MFDSLLVMRRFVCRPRRVGAVFASGPGLCRSMVREAGVCEAASIVELGPGTGVITGEILHKKSAESVFFAVELDLVMYRTLREKFPDVAIYNADAAELGHLCDEAGTGCLDAVVSALPFAAFSRRMQSAILEAVVANLAPDGTFVTFAYLQGVGLPSGWRFRHLLHEFFEEVTVPSVVWGNLPPALIYRCRHPRFKRNY